MCECHDLILLRSRAGAVRRRDFFLSVCRRHACLSLFPFSFSLLPTVFLSCIVCISTIHIVIVVVYAWFVSLSAAFRFVVVSFCVSERELTLTD